MNELVYTVQPSDEQEGLFGIAKRLYGDGKQWVTIYEASRALVGHNPNIIRAGQQLIIPEYILGEVAVVRVYVVQAADVYDGLAAIAVKLWNDPERWQELYAINRGTIGDDPHQIQAGQCLIVPSSR